jgi:hypothetical protein
LSAVSEDNLFFCCLKLIDPHQVASSVDCSTIEFRYQLLSSTAHHIFFIERDNLNLYMARYGVRCFDCSKRMNVELVFIQVYEALEQKLVVAESAQRLRLPFLSKDGELPEEEIERGVSGARTSVESTPSSTRAFSISGNGSNAFLGSTATAIGGLESGEAGVGGVVNSFLGVTPAWLRQVHLPKALFAEVC